MTNGSGSAQQLFGTVEAVNSKGFRISGRWLNWSRWATSVTPPEPGQTVTVTLDEGGYVRAVTAASAEPAPSAPEAGVSAGAPTEAANRPQTTPPDPERRITRLVCINTATAILSSGGRAITDVFGVLNLAETLERWVQR